MTFTLRAMGALPTSVPCVCMISILEASRLSEGSVWGRKEDTLVAITRTSELRWFCEVSEGHGHSWPQPVADVTVTSLVAGVTV